MASIKDEIMTFRNLVSTFMPATTKYKLEDMPKEPTAETLVIRCGRPGKTSSLTAGLRETDRTYELIYFGSTNLDVINTASLLDREITEYLKIQIGTSADYLTVGAFSASAVLRTEQDVPFTICLVEVTSYSARRLGDNTPIIESVETTITND